MIMITSSTLNFLTALSQNNSKQRMDKNRDRYYESKQEIILISKKLIELISEFDPHIAWANLDPKKSIFRINRYRRFWKNKSPYKENFGISISLGGRRSDYAWYYLHIQPWGKSMLWWWVRRPSKEVTQTIREHILDDWNSFRSIIKNDDFVRMYLGLKWDSLKRPPKGFQEYKDDAAMKYMKMKDRYVNRPLLDEQVLGWQLLELCELWYKTIAPLNTWINKCIQEDLL